jgi:hypothetical protein
MKTKNGVLIDPIGPYCYKTECREEYTEQCLALYDMELSYAVRFAGDKDILEIIGEYPDRAKQIITLIKETGPLYPSGLSTEAAQNWQLLNDKFSVFEKANRHFRI